MWPSYSSGCARTRVARERQAISRRSATRAELEPWIKYQAGCDYVFNAFAGHGHMVQADYGRADTVVCLRDGEDLRVKKLNPGNKRVAILADCCRNLTIATPASCLRRSGPTPSSLKTQVGSVICSTAPCWRPRKAPRTCTRAIRTRLRPTTTRTAGFSPLISSRLRANGALPAKERCAAPRQGFRGGEGANYPDGGPAAP